MFSWADLSVVNSRQNLVDHGVEGNWTQSVEEYAIPFQFRRGSHGDGVLQSASFERPLIAFVEPAVAWIWPLTIDCLREIEIRAKTFVR